MDLVWVLPGFCCDLTDFLGLIFGAGALFSGTSWVRFVRFHFFVFGRLLMS
jgi:hypothetical protein